MGAGEAGTTLDQGTGNYQCPHVTKGKGSYFTEGKARRGGRGHRGLQGSKMGDMERDRPLAKRRGGLGPLGM